MVDDRRKADPADASAAGASGSATGGSDGAEAAGRSEGAGRGIRSSSGVPVPPHPYVDLMDPAIPGPPPVPDVPLPKNGPRSGAPAASPRRGGSDRGVVGRSGASSGGGVALGDSEGPDGAIEGPSVTSGGAPRAPIAMRVGIGVWVVLAVIIVAAVVAYQR
jgi:hypothetical protein